MSTSWAKQLLKRSQKGLAKENPKYKNKQTFYKDRSFGSKAEALTAAHFDMLTKMGSISQVRFQVSVLLTESEIKYIADFVYFDHALKQDVYAETKGFETDVWKIKKRLWKHYGPGLLRVYKVQRDRVILTEEIWPVNCERKKSD